MPTEFNPSSAGQPNAANLASQQAPLPHRVPGQNLAD